MTISVILDLVHPPLPDKITFKPLEETLSSIFNEIVPNASDMLLVIGPQLMFGGVKNIDGKVVLMTGTGKEPGFIWKLDFYAPTREEAGFLTIGIKKYGETIAHYEGLQFRKELIACFMAHSYHIMRQHNLTTLVEEKTNNG